MAALFRLTIILWCFYRRGVLALVYPHIKQHLPKPLGWIFRHKQSPHNAKNLRQALQELGPIFVKLGQILSTRPDIIPADVAAQLRFLQDQVAPFDSDLAIAIIEQNLGQPLAQLFVEFDKTPCASASVAQVHKAKLASGEAVAVKVIRPDIEATIALDIQVLYILANWLERLWDEAYRLHAPEVIADFEATLWGELDMLKEAANANRLHHNFATSDLLTIPSAYWAFCGPRVLVLQWVSGVPVGDIATLKQNNVNFKKLAETGVEIFFQQVFNDNFFHADMHPGNIFVDVSDPENPRYIAVDFGIVGSLPDADQHYMALILLAFFKQDYHAVAQLHVDCGWVPKTTPVHEFEAAIRFVCEPIFKKPLAEISFGQVLVQLFQTARRFDMQVQPQLVLLQKTLLNIEGLGRQLYPELDLWTTGQPFLEAWVKNQLNPLNQIKNLFTDNQSIFDTLPKLPSLGIQALEQIASLGTRLNETQETLQLMHRHWQLEQQQRRRHRQVLWFLGTAFVSYSAIAQMPSLNSSALNPWLLATLVGYFCARWVGGSDRSASTRAKPSNQHYRS